MTTQLQKDMLEASRRRLGLSPAYTPEHSGLSDDGRVLSIQEAMPGGGRVVDADSLKAQAEPEVEPISVFAVDRDIAEAQRLANTQVAKETQRSAEKQARKEPDSGQPDADSGNGV
jgi:hypothetical protein